ncbi:ABC transporter substrate-binding protein [Solidesulfovibrio sp.]|uniref:ABC transporter substrate-binding protein n=1 Tax=Solidesulfovibrio sp. TaxID=2910990 RepID=UPI00260C8FD4|nr:ABC transporter substrate-binding protein [Solidesulfovibrio sp.]
MRQSVVRLALFLALLAALGVPGRAESRTLTDMAGRKVALPGAPTRVYALSPPDALLVYAIDPCLLAGWNYPPYPPTAGYLPPCAQDLPVLGGFFGRNETPNKEAILSAKPQLAVSGSMAKPHEAINAFFKEHRIPVLTIQSETPGQYPAALRLLGAALHRRERAEKLAAWADDALEQVRRGLAAIPQDKRPTVYYAEGGDGLYTDGADSFHTLVLTLAGGVNVHARPQTERYGMDRVSIETVVGYAPQVILAQDAKCRDMILSSPAWSEIPAVKAGRVLLLPDAPFGWFDRPPSFMRLLCLKWLASALYPEVFPYDMVKETKEFYKLFLQVELTDEAAAALLRGERPAAP